MIQKTLFPDSKIDAAFERFDADNPKVYQLFKRFAAEARAAGHKRYSSDAILHRIRWHVSVETIGCEFKINDHFSSRFARKLIGDDASFAEFFELRTLKS